MKKLILATTLGALISAPAFAADMAAHMPMKAPMMAAPVTSWQGLYIGGNVGYGWGNNNTDVAFLPSAAAFGVNNLTLNGKTSGVMGGAQIGYNWQVGSLVTGLEADIQGSGIKGDAHLAPLFSSAGNPLNGSSQSSDQKLSWFGTVRGRLGFTVTPDVLLYATGGVAYGQIDASANTRTGAVFFEFPTSISTTKAGWTAGAGTEWMFARNWSAKVEYLYIDLGKASAIADRIPPNGFQVGYTWHAQENIVRAGVNYHF